MEKALIENSKLQGFFHLTIRSQDDKIVGDSGWVKNNIPNEGFQHYIGRRYCSW
jgi:hypothetical protein